MPPPISKQLVRDALGDARARTVHAHDERLDQLSLENRRARRAETAAIVRRVQLAAEPDGPPMGVAERGRRREEMRGEVAVGGGLERRNRQVRPADPPNQGHGQDNGVRHSALVGNAIEPRWRSQTETTWNVGPRGLRGRRQHDEPQTAMNREDGFPVLEREQGVDPAPFEQRRPQR